MRKVILVLALAGLVASPAWAGYWDQLCPVNSYAGASVIDYDTPKTATSADDFLCSGSGPITDIEWTGFSQYGEQYIVGFRIAFWTDVPETPDDESHPGDLVWTRDFSTWGVEDPPECGSNHYKVNDIADPFIQTEGEIYWISIQGIMEDDGYSDTWYWYFRDPELTDPWGDNAAFESEYWGYAPWANWGFPTLAGGPDVYEGTMPPDWAESADMSFRLIPEPASLGLLLLGSLALLRRR